MEAFCLERFKNITFNKTGQPILEIRNIILFPVLGSRGRVGENSGGREQQLVFLELENGYTIYVVAVADC